MATVSAEDYARFAAALKGADKAVARAIRKRIREESVPIGEHVVREGSADMPTTGGLSERLAAGRPTVSILAKGASINLRKGANYKGLNAGVLRHPVYGRSKSKWVAQPVPAGTYTAAFDDLPADARERLSEIVADAMKELGL